MKTRRIAAVVLFAFLPATLSLPAAAQDDASTVQARARFKEGVEAFDKGKYEEARLAFLQAYTLKKHPAVLLNLAQSSAKSGHQLDAARYFQQFLKEATTATPQQKKDAEAGLAEARKQVARIDVVAPAGTEITIDDQKVGATPFDAVDVEPGVHTVKSPVQSVTVTAVIGQKVEAKLGSVPQSQPVFPTTPPPAETAPSNASTSSPSSADSSGSVSADTTQAKHTSLLSPPENMLPVYVGLGVGAAGLVGGILFAVFKVDSQSKADDVAQQIRAGADARNIPRTGACTSTAPGASDLAAACKTLQDNNDKTDTNATVANVSFVVMGVGLATAAVWYLVGPKRDDAKTQVGSVIAPKRPMLTPYAGWQSGGLSLTGEF